MAKKKKGPPYTDDPECKYVVIEDPFPGGHGKHRNQMFFNFVGAWLWFMLGKTAGPEYIYALNTRDDVVAKFPEHVDVTPLLGAHSWRDFLRADAAQNRTSYIFEYNYRTKGHPENHQWTEYVPAGGEPPAHLRFPVLFPYPPPSWASPVGRSAQDLALPIPLPKEPATPAAVQAPTSESGTGASNDPRLKADVKPGSHPLYTSKLDPYDEEKLAISSLKIKLESVKKEDPDRVHEPSAGLIAAIEAYERSKSIKAEPAQEGVKKEDPDRECQPSAALVAAIAEYERVKRVKQEDASSNQEQEPSAELVSVIEAYERQLQAERGAQPGDDSEVPNKPSGITTRDPRLAAQQLKRMKSEQELDSEEHMKKRRL